MLRRAVVVFVSRRVCAVAKEVGSWTGKPVVWAAVMVMWPSLERESSADCKAMEMRFWRFWKLAEVEVVAEGGESCGWRGKAPGKGGLGKRDSEGGESGGEGAAVG
jgi:hypothetical protein